jgi:hypothetical protein
MPQLWSGHRERSGSARRTGDEPCEGSSSASERQKRWLAQRQVEEKAASKAASGVSPHSFNTAEDRLVLSLQ